LRGDASASFQFVEKCVTFLAAIPHSEIAIGIGRSTDGAPKCGAATGKSKAPIPQGRDGRYKIKSVERAERVELGTAAAA
jgi:hypothetical protein